MKIDRLIGILSILLQKEKVTAPGLASMFEVSRRTINRDIEDLCKAGIPVVTARGVRGGISIMEGYKIDSTILTSRDVQAIFAGLKSLDSVCGSSRYKQLMDKLWAGNTDMINAHSHIMINLSSWYRESLGPKIHLIQDAIEGTHLIEFTYYTSAGETSRKIEPYVLVFQWSSWYVRGYCLLRDDYRLFKLNRMVSLEQTGEIFEKRDVSLFENEPFKPFPVHFHVKAVCQPSIKWKILDEYGPESLEELPDGKLLFQAGYTDKENLISWILGMGDQMELLEPEELRGEIKRIAENISAMYKET